MTSRGADCNRSPGEGWSTHFDLLLRISCPSLSAHRRIMLAGEGARPTCGSPMRNIEYCYFHYRWRMTTVDLSHSAHHVTTEFVLPVLEDADSIQITLGQIMRMIVCRQVDTKSAGRGRPPTSDSSWGEDSLVGTGSFADEGVRATCFCSVAGGNPGWQLHFKNARVRSRP